MEQSMKFDIDKAKAGMAVETSDGEPVRILCYDREGAFTDKAVPIVGLVMQAPGVEVLLSWKIDGTSPSLVPHSLLDLRMAPVKVVKWASMYRGQICNGGHLYNSREDAENNERGYEIAKVEWEE